jgi:hypothetical protein
MPLLDTQDKLGDFLGVSGLPLDATTAKALKNGHVLVSSTEVPLSDTHESFPAENLEFPSLQDESFPRAVELSRIGQDDQEAARIAVQILKIIETYGSHDAGALWSGTAGHVPLVTEQIKSGEPIRLLFSGFGFKLPQSSGKVLGSLPDLGEKLALGHLNGLCSNIARVYEKGAEVHICSDGLVYNGWSTCPA